jgi:hypothetical protein
MAKTANGKDEVAIMGGGPNRLVPLPGARNIRTLSAPLHCRPAGALGKEWDVGPRRGAPEVSRSVVDNYVMLARVIRLEADVKHSMAKLKTVDEALAELESRVGTKGRRKFEKFLREVAEDEDEDVVDVESK